MCPGSPTEYETVCLIPYGCDQITKLWLDEQPEMSKKQSNHAKSNVIFRG